MTDLTVLQAVRLKGRVSPADLAQTLDADETAVTDTIRRLAADGLLIEGATVRISPHGRARLAEWLAAERLDVDTAALAAAYAEFGPVNTDFKALVTAWQLNHDATVMSRLDDVHRRVVPIIEAVATQLPRLTAYRTKLVAALDKIRAGEMAWLTRPLVDSYHTVWFELHEELILAVGMTREEAAKAGDAQ